VVQPQYAEPVDLYAPVPHGSPTIMRAECKYSEVLWRRLRRLTWPTVATRRAGRVICR